MAEFREVRRVAKWWECVIVLAFFVAFAFVIRAGFQPPKSDDTVFRYFFIPLYGVWFYSIVAMFLNKYSLTASPEGLTFASSPIPVKKSHRIPREQIAFCYYFTILAGSDQGDSVIPITQMTGIEMKSGRQVGGFEYKTGADAYAVAQNMARAMNEGVFRSPVELREVKDPRLDPADVRGALIWGGICGAAILAGTAWEVLFRRGWL